MLFFLFEKYVPEKVAGEKESGDEDRDEEEGKFDERNREDANCPEDPEPQKGAFFCDVPGKRKIEGAPEKSGSKSGEREDEQELGEAETCRYKRRKQGFDGEEAGKIEVADDESFDC